MVGPLAYLGGKNRVAKTIISLIPEHTTYVEPFAGGAQVLFHKSPSKVEILNDLNEDVFNFLRICQLHHEELVRYLQHCIKSRRWFELLQQTNPATLTDVQRAARFFYLQKNCYGGLINRQSFSTSVEDAANYNPHRIPMLLNRAHERLLGVQLECLPYQQVLKKCDRPSTFFYLDPPYFGLKHYRFNFSEADFVRLAEELKRIKGRFLLSLNDTPEVRKIFSDFQCSDLSFAYSAQPRAGRKYRELLISNYPIRLEDSIVSSVKKTAQSG
jgi:DNA adenine methylase